MGKPTELKILKEILMLQRHHILRGDVNLIADCNADLTAFLKQLKPAAKWNPEEMARISEIAIHNRFLAQNAISGINKASERMLDIRRAQLEQNIYDRNGQKKRI